jgi:hypothetical protein
MIGERDMDRILRGWANEGVDRLPDRLADAILADVARLPQRRGRWAGAGLVPDRRWLGLALVAALLLALLAAFLLAGGARWLVPPKPFPATEATPIEAGRYVIDAPFPFRFEVTVPEGWIAGQLEGNMTVLARNEPDPWSQLAFVIADAMYLDPCHPELGIRRLGPTAGDFAEALRALPRVPASEASLVSIGGRSATAVTLTVPASTGCTQWEPQLPIWDVPQAFGFSPGFRHRFWVLDMPGGRLIIAAQDTGARTAGAVDIDAIVASIDFSVAPVPRPTEDHNVPGGTDEPPLPVLPASGPIPLRPDGYVTRVALYAYASDGTAHRAPGEYDWVLPVLSGWYRTPHGMEHGATGAADASLNVWSVARVYVDPCRWSTSSIVLEGASRLQELDAVAATLSAWWAQAPDRALTGDRYTRPPLAPTVDKPTLHNWNSRFAYHLDLEVPADVDLAACDDREYRLWEDHDGSARSARPGERVHLEVIALDAGVIVLEAGSLRVAPPPTVANLDEMFRSSWIGPTLLPHPSPSLFR